MVFFNYNKLNKTEEEENDEMQLMKLGKYEIGRTLGQGNFGKIKYAKDIQTECSFALKIIDKNHISHHQVSFYN